MALKFDLYQLPGHIPQGSLSGTSAVTVDILRAGTTIAAALHSGAAGIVPCIDVRQALDERAAQPANILGGERHGVIIDGFDLSNSPTEYTTAKVKDRAIAFSTTNGTRAIHAGRPADQVLVGSFSNITACCHELLKCDRSVAVICAGTDGKPTLEDLLFGGALYGRLASLGWGISNGKQHAKLNLAAHSAVQMWKIAERQMETGKSLATILMESQGGKNLVQLGLAADIEYSAVQDRFSFVPIFDRQRSIITANVDQTDRAR